jgi:uncharacterized protein
MPTTNHLTGVFLTALMLVGLALPPSAAAETTVLVYTRNHVTGGKGFVHDNIAASVDMVRRLGRQAGFTVEHSEDPAVFTAHNLKRFAAIVFSNSNNEAFENDAQRDAFQGYIRGGGAFVGIHSASGSERQWPWFWSLLGGKFKRHPPLQPFTLHVLESNHPATAHLGGTWEWEDEFYYLDHLNPRMQVLLAGDLTTLKDPQKDQYPGRIFGDLFPLAWCQEFDGGRQFYTALGHKIEHYSDPKFEQHVLGGILWTLRKSAKP